MYFTLHSYQLLIKLILPEKSAVLTELQMTQGRAPRAAELCQKNEQGQGRAHVRTRCAPTPHQVCLPTGPAARRSVLSSSPSCVEAEAWEGYTVRGHTTRKKQSQGSNSVSGVSEGHLFPSRDDWPWRVRLTHHVTKEGLLLSPAGTYFTWVLLPGDPLLRVPCKTSMNAQGRELPLLCQPHGTRQGLGLLSHQTWQVTFK